MALGVMLLMPDNKIKNSSASKKTPLFSSNNKSVANTNLRFKDLRGDHERSISEDDTPESPPNDIEMHAAPATDNEAGNKSLLTAIGYGLLASALLIVGIHIFRVYLSPTIEVEVDEFNTVSQQTSKRTFNPPRVTIHRPLDIGDIVSNIMKDKIWDIHKMHFLRKNWVQLDTKKQSQISGEEWFKEFQTALNEQLNSPTTNSLLSKEQIIARSSALMELQGLLANVAPPHTKLATVEHTKTPAVSATPSKISNDTHNSNMTDTSVTKTIEEIPSTQISATVEPPKNSQPQKEPQKLLLADTGTKRESPEITPPAEPADAAASTPIEINNIADAAVEEHENSGSSDNATTLAKITHEQLQPTIEKSKNAESRQKPPPERITANEPVPTDALIQKSTPKVAAVKKATEEKKYYYVNGSIESLLNNRPQGKLTVAEINDLVIQLSNSYERGDFKGFSSLFANDPSHESDNTLEKTKKQFEDWLSGTSDRQMFIKELNWAFNKNVAMSKGVLSLTLISNSHPRIVTIKKSIELTVRKDDQKVYITKFEQSDL